MCLRHWKEGDLFDLGVLDNIYLFIAGFSWFEGSMCLLRFYMYSCEIAREEAVFRDIFVNCSIVSAIQPPL